MQTPPIQPVRERHPPLRRGRKGWLFCDTSAGAKASANLFSLIETAKANELEPHAYLSVQFNKLSTLRSLENLEACLPSNFMANSATAKIDHAIILSAYDRNAAKHAATIPAKGAMESTAIHQRSLSRGVLYIEIRSCSTKRSEDIFLSMNKPGKNARPRLPATINQSGAAHGVIGRPRTRLTSQNPSANTASPANETSEDTPSVAKWNIVDWGWRGYRRVKNAYCRR
jgi:hypothetical protein